MVVNVNVNAPLWIQKSLEQMWMNDILSWWIDGSKGLVMGQALQENMYYLKRSYYPNMQSYP
jgi:hypothetical protein